jgi:predicted nucleic acid-binding protein
VSRPVTIDASAVRRATGQPVLAAKTAAAIDALGDVVLVPLDHLLAQEASDLCVQTGLRGADAVYVATARRFDAILVTLDEEQKRRVPDGMTALYPSEVLEG